MSSEKLSSCVICPYLPKNKHYYLIQNLKAKKVKDSVACKFCFSTCFVKNLYLRGKESNEVHFALVRKRSHLTIFSQFGVEFLLSKCVEKRRLIHLRHNSISVLTASAVNSYTIDNVRKLSSVAKCSVLLLLVSARSLQDV